MSKVNKLQVKMIFLIYILVLFFQMNAVQAQEDVVEDTENPSCTIQEKPNIPKDAQYTLGAIDDKPIVMISWDISENANIDDTDIDKSLLTDTSYRVEKEVGGQKIDLVLDNSEIDNYNIGGFLIDNAIELNKTYIYRIYAYDTVNDIESEPAVLTVEVTPPEEEKCDADPALKGTVEQLDASTQVVRLDWTRYCEDDVSYKLFRDKEEILTIKPEEVEGYLAGENTIDYVDKTIEQGKDVEYEYKVEVWGPAKTTSSNFLIMKAYAAGEEKKAESTTKVKDGKALSTASPTSIMPPKAGGLADIDLLDLIRKIIRYIFGIAMILLFIMLLYGGILYITSQGEEQKTEKAKKTLYFAILGTIFVFSAWAIAEYVIRVLK